MRCMELASRAVGMSIEVSSGFVFVVEGESIGERCWVRLQRTGGERVLESRSIEDFGVVLEMISSLLEGHRSGRLRRRLCSCCLGLAARRDPNGLGKLACCKSGSRILGLGAWGQFVGMFHALEHCAPMAGNMSPVLEAWVQLWETRRIVGSMILVKDAGAL